jgi:FkbM family methyltransferase
MTFVTYAQNYEDVLLWRCFRNIDTGFYIDVGSYNPEIDSVTKAFYDRGWSGINIEPNPKSLEPFFEKRPRDTNIQLLVGKQKEINEFWYFDGTGLSTANQKYAKMHISAGMLGEVSQVLTETLANICNKWVTSEIHFLKIDVEGFEKEVLEGADFKRFRPKVVVIESTIPNSQIETHTEWEQILIENGYSFCYKDGLNRFYLSLECEYLRNNFTYPPNVFDDFITAKQFTLQTEKSLIGIEVNLFEQLEQERNKLQNIMDSKSWKITSPLRRLRKLLRFI